MIMINTLILQAPAETTRYLIAGYTVIFGIMLLYVVSLVVRSRNLKREIETLKQLDEEKK
jgi:CcmD family protein